MQAEKYRQVFLDLSSELTGYDSIDLVGTGLVDEYRRLVEHEIGPDVARSLYDAANRVLKQSGKARAHAIEVEIAASPLLWPVCQSLIALWYLGQWNRMTPGWYKYYARCNPPDSKADPGKSFVPSAAAYTTQLSYRAAGAHPPGANPTGFGSWGITPVFGDFSTDGKSNEQTL